jgi:hypothetical protein
VLRLRRRRLRRLLAASWIRWSPPTRNATAGLCPPVCHTMAFSWVHTSNGRSRHAPFTGLASVLLALLSASSRRGFAAADRGRHIRPHGPVRGRLDEPSGVESGCLALQWGFGRPFS